MRIPTLAGIVLVIAGAFFLLPGGTLTSRRDVLKVGDLTVSAEEQHSIPPWVAGFALVTGLVLVVTGMQRKGVRLRQ